MAVTIILGDQKLEAFALSSLCVAENEFDSVARIARI